MKSSSLSESFLNVSPSILSTRIWYLDPLICKKPSEQYSWIRWTIWDSYCWVICLSLWWNLLFSLKGTSYIYSYSSESCFSDLDSSTDGCIFYWIILAKGFCWVLFKNCWVSLKLDLFETCCEGMLIISI